ncbi:MAG: hydrolase 1, exosortase A system-associated [Candidatus Accumulibacter sp.]|nr:hydrolase 1, exosortase A system-associated [Accumulibacter sp.]
MDYTEIPLTFAIGGEAMPGIVALPDAPFDCGVLVVVGGPQYRAGSHRQFLLLSRRLAGEGYPVFRFDYRGMGDADGAARSFEDVSEDIGAAIDAFRRRCPALRRVVLWGLCDAASAILMYLRATGDPRVGGVALLNPWVRSDASLARTRVKHYYGRRLTQRGFWRKLLAGRLDVAAALRGLLENARTAWRKPAERDHGMSFQDRMAEGLRRFRGSALLILGGRDETAREFIEYANGRAAWRELLAAGNVSRVEIAGADHTFSSAAWRAAVENASLRWLDRLRETGGAG